MKLFTNKAGMTLRGGVLLALLAALALVPATAPAQTVAVPTAENPFGLPEDITIFGKTDPNRRAATAVVNGYVITGTDIDQRVALVTASSEAPVSDEELLALAAPALSSSNTKFPHPPRSSPSSLRRSGLHQPVR